MELFRAERRLFLLT